RGGRRALRTAIRTRRRLVPIWLVALLAVVAAPAPPASAQGGAIFRDCADGRLDGDYSPSEIRRARQNIPTDVDEYTDCRDVLTSALGDALGKPGGTGSDGPSGSSDNSGGVPAPGAGGSGDDGAGGTPSRATAPGTARPPAGAPELLTPTPEEERELADALGNPEPVKIG